MRNLVWLLFLPGFLCNPNPLKINPDSLMAWKGSCVLIPCRINSYKGAVLRDVSLLWYFQPFYIQTEYSGHLLYNSSSSRYKTRLQSASAGRWEFVGNLVNKNCSLKISQLRAEDEGIYGARLFASYNSRPVRQEKWFQNATVHVAESPPKPGMGISPEDIREQWTTVTCSVPYHCPDEPLRLTIRGTVVSRLSSPRMTISNGMIKTVVNFQATWEDHGKSLVCSLETQQRSEISKSTLQLDVKYAPKNVRLTASPGTTVREGETLSLACTSSSSNPEVSEYLWYKDGQPMNEWQKFKNKIDFQTEGDRHSGAYRCEAKNSVGSQKSEALVIDVQYPPKEAKVERWPEGDIKEGDSVGLTCSSKGNPPIASYEWYKLPQTDVFQKSERLQFDAIQLENAGTFYCVANNSLGHSESSPVTLDVHYVHLALENSQLPVREKDTVTLNCSFSHSTLSNPVWYRWSKGTSKLQKQGNLLIFSAVLEEAGDYRCEACSKVKCVSSPAVTVDIHSLPQNPSATPTAGPEPTTESAQSQNSSAPPTSGPEPTAESEGPQSSPPPPSSSESVSSPWPSTSCPPPVSELPPSWAPIPSLPSPQTPCDGSFLSSALDQVVKAQNQFIHSCKDLTLAMVHLTEQFQKALLQIQQKTCRAPGEKQ